MLEGAATGNLCIADSWPGQMRTVYGDHQRFIDTYFKAYPGKYFTGDGCRRDADGYYWITGRVDDVINVSGHRMGTAEVESALVAHAKVSEAAVVGYPHDIKGQGIYAYVTLMAGEQPTEELRKELVGWVRKEIGPIAAPDLIQFAPGLPTSPTSVAADEEAKTEVAGADLDLGERDLRHVDERRGDAGGAPDDEHSEEMTRPERRGRDRCAHVRRGPSRWARRTSEACRDARDDHGRDGKGDRVAQYAIAVATEKARSPPRGVGPRTVQATCSTVEEATWPARARRR